MIQFQNTKELSLSQLKKISNKTTNLKIRIHINIYICNQAKVQNHNKPTDRLLNKSNNRKKKKTKIPEVRVYQ